MPSPLAGLPNNTWTFGHIFLQSRGVVRRSPRGSDEKDNVVGLVYDERMAKHRNLEEPKALAFAEAEVPGSSAWWGFG